MLNKLFGGKKSNYFLELKEEESSEKTSKTEVSVQPEEQKAPEAPAAEEKPAQAETKSSKSKKSSIKGKKSASKTQKQPEAPAEAVPLVTPFPTMATAASPRQVADPSQNGKAETQEVAFASNSVITPTMARRRPGPSLNTFKSMARSVKKPTSR